MVAFHTNMPSENYQGCKSRVETSCESIPKTNTGNIPVQVHQLLNI